MATALELGPEGWKPYLEGLRSRPEPLLSPEQAAERDRLIEKARQAAAMLKEKYGATRVILFGSLAHDLWFDEWTDVDLAVEGMPPRDFFKAWDEAEVILRGRKLDLVELAHAREMVLEDVARRGVEL